MTVAAEALSRGRQHQAAGRMREAADAYRQALKQEPAREDIRAALVQTQLVIALCRGLHGDGHGATDSGSPRRCRLGRLVDSGPEVLAVPDSVLEWTRCYKNNLADRAARCRDHIVGPASGAASEEIVVFPVYFAEFVYADFVTLKSHLPATAPLSVLDIGCGFAGQDLLVHRHYGAPPAMSFALLDRAEVDGSAFTVPVLPGGPGTPHLHPLEAATAFLSANGIGADSLRQVADSAADSLRDTRFDLVLAIRSWGYMFPLATYADLVAAVLAPGGTIVVDVHRDQGGLAAFQTLFPGAARIGGTRTIDRCLAVAV